MSNLLTQIELTYAIDCDPVEARAIHLKLTDTNIKNIHICFLEQIQLYSRSLNSICVSSGNRPVKLVDQIGFKMDKF